MSRKKHSTFEITILKTLEKLNKPTVSVDELLKALGYDDAKSLKRIHKSLRRLSAHEKIIFTQGNTISLVKEKPSKSDKVSKSSKQMPSKAGLIGIVDVNQYGVGFVSLPDYDNDIKIPERWMNTALKGDRVEVVLVPSKRSGGRVEGKIKQIVSRSNRILVGKVGFIGNDSFIITPDHRSAHTDFWMSRSFAPEVTEGDKIIFRLKSWESSKSMPEGEFVDLLGDDESNDASMLSILAENQFVATFPEQVEKDAAKISLVVDDAIISQRMDYRKERVFTIDPFDAKDFDDALSIKHLDNGNVELGVHIADVSHYVIPDSELDKEAFIRATSVYLVDRTIPMLPEVLSNGICSLVPHEDRLTYSCIMELDGECNVVNYKIGETVIHSHHRFTYDEAQEIIEGAEHEFSKDILDIQNIAKTLTKRRIKAGSIDFDSPEPKFKLDPEGVPIEVIIKERKDAHRLIEECMLLANRTVAIHIDNLREAKSGKAKKAKDDKPQKDFPYLYRVHPAPDSEKLRQVETHLHPLGIFFTTSGKEITSRDIQKVLNKIKGTPYEHIINSLTLRSMAKAEYRPKNIGHFGLAFSHYAHFTSPIRRYPDVIVHRLLKAYAKSEKLYSYSDLEASGQHCSQREREAQNAERDSIKLKQVEYMSRHIGEEFEGIITGVTEFGVYVEMQPHLCEGMIRMHDLDDDYYKYDADRHQLVGTRRGRKLRLGSLMKVSVSKTNIRQRTIDLKPVFDTK